MKVIVGMTALSKSEMKIIKGGGPEDPPGQVNRNGHCYVDGEIINETICTIDAQCQTLYGPQAKCYIL